MAREVLIRSDLPPVQGPSSHGVKADGWAFTAGILPLAADSTIVGTSPGVADVEAQSARCVQSMSSVLEALDVSLAQVTKVKSYMSDLRHRERYESAYAEAMPEPYPAHACVGALLPVRDAVVQLEATACVDDLPQPVELHSGEATGGVRLAIVRDPSGNAIELVEREGPPAVGGARLIVRDRAEAEEFFVRIFGATPEQRIQTDTFDEVFMNVGQGMFVALFEPTGVASLPKSENPVVAIYSTEFDAVLERVKAGGLRVRERSAGMFFADDPSGNVVEVVRQSAP